MPSDRPPKRLVAGSPADWHTVRVSMTGADIDIVRLWCREQAPQEGWARRRVEPVVTGRHIDLVVVRVDAVGAESRTPIARLRFLNTRRWQLYWRDAGGTFRVYGSLPASDDVRDLLDFLARGRDPLFWPDRPDAEG